MKSVRNVLFRVDVSRQIGMGHLTRCITIGQALKKRRINSIFAAKKIESSSLDYLQGFKVCRLKVNSSFMADAQLTSRLAKDYSVRLIFADLISDTPIHSIENYGSYFHFLKRQGHRVAIIDGFYNRCVSSKIRLGVDLIIIPYVGAEQQVYQKEKNAIFLLGPQYFVFRDEFIRPLVSRGKSNSKKATKILITLGGSDLSNLTTRVMTVIGKLNAPDLQMRVVIGPAFDSSVVRKIKQIAAATQKGCKVIRAKGKMARLMSWADLAILSDGLTKYETTRMGLPSIVLTSAADKGGNRPPLHDLGSYVRFNLKNELDPGLLHLVEELLLNQAKRRQMSLEGKMTLDGRGTERICDAIERQMENQ